MVLTNFGYVENRRHLQRNCRFGEPGVSAIKVRLSKPLNPFISIRYIKVLQCMMPVGLAEITLPPQTKGLVFKVPKKVTLPENLSKNPKICNFPLLFGL